MRQLRRVCIYCGSSDAVSDVYKQAARQLAQAVARRGAGIVFGGGRVGLMGQVADAALEAGAEVVGVIPEKLQTLELGHQGISELIVVPDMHERKRRMAELSDAFIALPGGWGTLEELAEATTWSQLNYHLKPVGVLDVGGFYRGLLEFIGHAADEGFIRTIHRDMLQVADDPDDLLDRLERVHVPELSEWLGVDGRRA